MDLAEWSSAGILDIICLDVGVRVFGVVNWRPTIVKDGADRLDGRPSEGERLGDARLLAHNV